MDTMQAFALGQAALARGDEHMVFDWNKAAQFIVERRPEEAIAGLARDMEWTSGPIFRDGAPVPEEDTYVFLASPWATPILRLICPEADEDIPCWLYMSQAPEWNEKTYWPESALEILKIG